MSDTTTRVSDERLKELAQGWPNDGHGPGAKWCEDALAALRQLRDDAAQDDDFRAYFVGELSRFPCMCGDGKHSAEATPPMMWPEWIACIVAKAVKDALAALSGKEKT